LYSALSALGLSAVQFETVAKGQPIGAFLMPAFLISHLYLATTGHKITSQVKAMITGYEDVEK